MRRARDFAESIVEGVRSPLLVVDSRLYTKKTSAAFYEAFLVTPTKTENRLIYDLGNGQWNIPEMRRLFEELLVNEARISVELEAIDEASHQAFLKPFIYWVNPGFEKMLLPASITG